MKKEYVPGTTTPKPKVRLVGEDGNAYSILSRTRKALRQAGVPQEIIDEFKAKAKRTKMKTLPGKYLIGPPYCDGCIYLYQGTGPEDLCAVDHAVIIYDEEHVAYICKTKLIRCTKCRGMGMIGLDGNAPLSKCEACHGRGLRPGESGGGSIR